MEQDLGNETGTQPSPKSFSLQRRPSDSCVGKGCLWCVLFLLVCKGAHVAEAKFMALRVLDPGLDSAMMIDAIAIGVSILVTSLIIGWVFRRRS